MVGKFLALLYQHCVQHTKILFSWLGTVLRLDYFQHEVGPLNLLSWQVYLADPGSHTV
jgi:hypothetical protein